MTLREAFIKYLWYMENVRGFSHGTIKQRRIYINYFLSWIEENRIQCLSELTNIDVDRYHAELRNRKNRKGSTNTVGTINTSIKAIRVFPTS